jgi:uncharacterized membrane protein YtjA (UPF0391 family)
MDRKRQPLDILQLIAIAVALIAALLAFNGLPGA